MLTLNIDSKRVLIWVYSTILFFLYGCSDKIVAQEFNTPSNPNFSSKSEIEATADVEIEAFMKKYNVPGASVAITKDGRLVFAKGYGYANIESGENVKVSNLFRVASLSKPITSVAILKLAEEGRLSLDDRVFDDDGILGNQFTLKDARIRSITIRQLLNHTSGGWPNNAEDPMFEYQDLTGNELIATILSTRTLHYDPGTHYAYSNFGYCILGKIIEEVSGTGYETFVKENLFNRIGISKMYVGKNDESEKYFNEVSYYSQQKAGPYSYNLERMEANGGWIASTVDLLKFLAHVDGFGSRKPLLSPTFLEQMTTASDVNPDYSLGWEINNSNNWWHTGALPGTSAIMVRTSSGYTWTMLLNTRSMESSFYSTMDRTLWKIVNSVQVWPDYDLFENELSFSEN